MSKVKRKGISREDKSKLFKYTPGGGSDRRGAAVESVGDARGIDLFDLRPSAPLGPPRLGTTNTATILVVTNKWYKWQARCKRRPNTGCNTSVKNMMMKTMTKGNDTTRI